MRKRRGSRDGLRSKVMNIEPFEDTEGKFIAYCNFGKHRGIVLRPNVCEARECKYYQKFYVNKKPGGD